MRTLQHWLVIIGLILGNGMLGAVSAQAQSDDLAWVQIESYTNVSQVQTRAAIYASGLDDVAAFQMNGGWYADRKSTRLNSSH